MSILAMNELIDGRGLPVIDLDNAPFFEGCARGQLMLQRCVSSGKLQFYPRPCSIETGGAVEWVAATGRGRIYSFSIIHQNYTAPEFKRALPYVLAMIELDEGLRMMGNVVGCSPETVRIGMPVRVRFDVIEQSSGLILPFWERVTEPS